MVSKSQSKLIRSLHQKKYRFKHGLFLVEGTKGISEFLGSSLKLQQLFYTEDIFDISEELKTLIDDKELKTLSQLTTPQKALAIFEIPNQVSKISTKKVMILDGVRDPGNLGTIIRLCDWFGIEQLVCSLDTVDCYNHKVVQATMGSLARVLITYTDISEYLKSVKLPVYGTFMDGKTLYSETLSEDYIIVMGNEANGISKEIEALCGSRIAIPQFGTKKDTESLNVATASAIILSEFARKTLDKD